MKRGTDRGGEERVTIGWAYDGGGLTSSAHYRKDVYS